MAEYDPPQPLWKRNLAGILDFALAMIVFGILSTKIFGPSKPLIPVSQNPNTSAIGLSGWALVVTVLLTVAYFVVLGRTGGTVFQRLFKMKRRGRRPPRHV